jgi:hypothetical protein
MMGLTILGFLWFFGMGVTAALPVMLMRRGLPVAFAGTAVACTLIELMHRTAQDACGAAGCGPLASVLADVRLSGLVLTVSGAAVGLTLALHLRRKGAAA